MLTATIIRASARGRDSFGVPAHHRRRSAGLAAVRAAARRGGGGVGGANAWRAGSGRSSGSGRRVTITGPGAAAAPTAATGRGGAGAGGRGAAAAGSAPAFPGTRPRDPNGRPVATGILRLRREPVLAVFTWKDGSGLASRAALVLERVEWPGKPGVVMEAPLTAEEELRFTAGSRIYASVCQTCHQQDGRGQDRLAPTLVGSTLAVARPDVTARILLQGKEGTMGLMPPLGATLSDGDIAAVLTYIRREWGQTGSPVDAATVSNVRTQTATRRTAVDQLRVAGDAERKSTAHALAVFHFGVAG